MEKAVRERLLRRISSKSLYSTLNYKNELIDVIFKDPSIDILTRADFLYKRHYDEIMADKGDKFTLEESYKMLEDDGVWTQKTRDNLAKKKKELELLEKGVEALKFHKARHRMALQQIDKVKKETEELEGIKNTYWKETIEYECLMAKRRFIARNCINSIDVRKKIYRIIGSEEVEIPTEEYLGYLKKNEKFLDLAAYCYFEENTISDKDMREIARSDPWRVYWSVSKTHGVALFNCPATEMSELQYNLIIWSKVYDFAYESTNRPPDEVIDDDTQFDLWYKGESQRIDEEIKKRNMPDVMSGYSDVFIPADIEGAREVYDMNSPQARANIKTRQDFIDKQKEVRETNLPDVQAELRMKANRMMAK